LGVCEKGGGFGKGRRKNEIERREMIEIESV